MPTANVVTNNSNLQFYTELRENIVILWEGVVLEQITFAMQGTQRNSKETQGRNHGGGQTRAST